MQDLPTAAKPFALLMITSAALEPTTMEERDVVRMLGPVDAIGDVHLMWLHAGTALAVGDVDGFEAHRRLVERAGLLEEAQAASSLGARGRHRTSPSAAYRVLAPGGSPARRHSRQGQDAERSSGTHGPTPGARGRRLATSLGRDLDGNHRGARLDRTDAHAHRAARPDRPSLLASRGMACMVY